MSKKIDLSDESMIFIMNYVLDNVKEDRTLALTHHDALNDLMGSVDGMSTVEMQVLLQEISSSITNFLNSATKSTENALKLAKLLSEHLSKMEQNAELSEDERDGIQRLVEKATEVEDELVESSDTLKQRKLGAAQIG